MIEIKILILGAVLIAPALAAILILLSGLKITYKI